MKLSEIQELSENDEDIRNVKDGIFSNKWHDSVNGYKILQQVLSFINTIMKAVLNKTASKSTSRYTRMISWNSRYKEQASNKSMVA